MHERFWGILYAVSLMVLGFCGMVTAINFIVADNGSGFLPDTAVKVMGITQCAALVLLVFSRIKQCRKK